MQPSDLPRQLIWQTLSAIVRLDGGTTDSRLHINLSDDAPREEWGIWLGLRGGHRITLTTSGLLSHKPGVEIIHVEPIVIINLTWSDDQRYVTMNWLPANPRLPTRLNACPPGTGLIFDLDDQADYNEFYAVYAELIATLLKLMAYSPWDDPREHWRNQPFVAKPALSEHDGQLIADELKRQTSLDWHTEFTIGGAVWSSGILRLQAQIEGSNDMDIDSIVWVYCGDEWIDNGVAPFGTGQFPQILKSAIDVIVELITLNAPEGR